MSQLLQLRDAIVVQIKAALLNFDVQGHLGRFTEADLNQFLTTAPAVRVAVLDLSGFADVSDDGVDTETQLGVFVVTKDGATRLSRDEQAIAAVEAIVKLADRNRWGLGSFVKGHGGVRGARNLYSKDALAKGVALWGLDYRVSIRLSPPAAQDGALPNVLIGVAPNIGLGHEGDYRPVQDLSEVVG